ncbi:MAG: hypothetical protein AVDCRST_MAG43-2161 [uncultured Thermomicrobiales bacterium]|uniref:Uncharacterized protein n=1 Tax=uncultured Thermomicrobiales bacterium TaxID=1645740 RepID=A0A6J4V318_9BACT|nr:MAG: hypothetical protein AVDCRST_MAG43-2161 [uncultured Thermomicrobiales bacterium]
MWLPKVEATRSIRFAQDRLRSPLPLTFQIATGAKMYAQKRF